MAKRAASRSGKQADPSQRIISAALSLAAAQGWHATSLADIAAAAEVSLAELRALYPSKAAVLAGYAASVDAKVLEAVDPDMAESPAHERLFDVLMKRFDVLNNQKPGIEAILRSRPCDLEAALCAPLILRRSMRWMLEAAGLRSSGLTGAVRIKALALVYLATLTVWLRDDSEDMARTMAALDRQLRRLDWLAGRLCRFRRGPARAPDDEAAAEAG